MTELDAIASANIICIKLLTIIGLGWPTFFSGIARSYKQAVDNTLVANVNEPLGVPVTYATNMAGAEH